MSLFKSQREKRLWIWALVVLAAIYSTLLLSGILTKIFYSQNFSAFIFLLVIALIAMSLITKEIRIPKVNKEIWIWLGIFAVYLMFFIRLTIPERSHLMEYSILAFLVHEALLERKKRGSHSTSPDLAAILIITLLGTLDECLQLYIPVRYFDPVDIFFNTLAGVLAIGASRLLAWGRGQKK